MVWMKKAPAGPARKRLEDMSLEEIQAEMREYPCDQEEDFAFISYSHRDRDRVYPIVLHWMRMGYNIYIDLDFENHGSDANWIDQMAGALARRTCHLAICFKSISYTYSYAALLELLTMRSSEVAWRHGNGREPRPLPVDVIGLERVPDESDIPRELKQDYREAFASLKENMGETFAQTNQKERQAMRDGLTDWLNSMDQDICNSINALGNTGDTLMRDIEKCYHAGMSDFYPWVAIQIKNWFLSQNLNGNTLPMSVNIRERFERAGVFQIREPVEPSKPKPEPKPEPPKPEPEPSDLFITKVVGPTDAKYKIFQFGTRFHVGFDHLVTVVMNGNSYGAKMHKTVKGRLDRLSDLYRKEKLAEGDTVEARYSAKENTIYLKKV